MTKEKLLKKQPFKGKVAILCGASTGMGKETAREFVKLGGSVLINARRVDVLEATAEDIKKSIVNESQFVEHIVGDATDENILRPLMEKFISKHGVPDYLFNVVGTAYPGYIEDLTIEDYKKNMDINYYGQVVPSVIMIPYFMKEKKGHIINFSSMMGYMGVIGYATYCPTKFALVGFSEVLRHELKPYKIKVSVVYPPDTNTPGLSTESEGKPKECVMMSESAGLLEAEEVAEILIKKILKSKYHISPGEAAPIRYLNRVFPKLVRWFIDKDLKKARKKLGKPYKY